MEKGFSKATNGNDFHNKKLGLIGFGRIGKKLRKELKLLILQINYSAVIKKKVILKINMVLIILI